MNKITKLIIAKKCLDMTKAQADIRGKEFTKVYLAFVSLFVWLFQEQAKFFIAYAENNPQMFTWDGGLIIEKYDEFGDMTPSEEFMNTIGSYLIKAHMIWQDTTNREVASQVNVLMELKNAYADAYAANRAGELMRAVNDTTKAEVRSLFNKWFQENWSLKEISNAIDEQFTQFGKYRANLIATMEVANAYEVGKKEQFSSYQSYFRVTGYKRSQSQQDSAVRYTHSLNEIDGWIPEDKTFSWTDTDHAPHWFNCRCVTTRKLTNPTVQDQFEAQFWKDKTKSMTDIQKKEMTDYIQELRRSVPWITKPTYIENASGNAAMHYVPKNWWFGVNPWVYNQEYWDNRLIFQTDVDAKIDLPFTISQYMDNSSHGVRASIAHEMWHAIWKNIDDYALSDTTTKLNGVTWQQLKKLKDWVSVDLLEKVQKGDIVLSRYAMYDIHELFSESVSAYWMWEYSRISQEMIDFLDIIFTL